MKYNYLIGERFGSLVIIDVFLKQYKLQRNSTVKYRCDCGRIGETCVSNILHGRSNTCPVCARIQHNKSRSNEYFTWNGMKNRCNNEKNSEYKNYGGRGISVCERWYKFKSFYEDMGDRPSSKHSLDRIDNNGNYEPENCRWATRTEQANNRRDNSRCVFVELYGERVTLSEAARRIGISRQAMSQRVKRGACGVE